MLLLLTVGVGEISAQGFFQMAGRALANQKGNSAVARLDRSKMYTQEEADSYYPLYNARTVHFDEAFVAGLGVGVGEGPIDFWVKGGWDIRADHYRQRTLNIDKVVVTINDTQSWEYLGYRMHNLKEVWYGSDVDVAAVLQKHVEGTDLYEFYSFGIHSRECTIFLPAEKYPKGIISIQEEVYRRTGDSNWKSVPTQLLKFKTLLYTGDVNEAFERGAAECKTYCPGHSYTAQVVAAHTVMRYSSCQANAKFYYSCKYCGECEHNAKHTFERDKFWNNKTESFPHAYVRYDLSAKNYVGRNSRGECVYQTSCYWCGSNGREEILNVTQEDLRMMGHNEITPAQYKEMMLSSWDAVQAEEALANVYVGGFDYPGFFAVPNTDHGARVTPEAENDTRWAMANGLIDREVLGTDYSMKINRQQLASLAVLLAEQVTGKSIKAAPCGTFTDSEDVYLLKAYAAGIIPYQCDGAIDPDAVVTRQEMSAYFFNALQYIKENSSIRYTVYTPNLELFADKGQIADWALEAMGFMNTLGFVKGTSKGAIEPMRVCTIEEAVVLAHKCFYADELGWYQCIRPDERGYAGSPGGATDYLGIHKSITAFPIPGADNVVGSYDNGSRFWVGENWIGRGFGRKSQREVFLPIVDKYTGTTLFVPGEEFLPIKAE